MDPTPVGIVDLGWTGQMFDSLWAVLRSWRAESPYGFLFGWSPAEGCNDGMLKEGYLFDGALRQGYDYLTSGTVALLETFCAARHGMVCGYCEDEHATKPILKETLNQAALAWGIPTLRKTVNAFIDNLALVDRETFLAMDCRMAAQDLLRALGTKPSGREASVWGAYGHFRIQTEAHGYPIAMPFSARHIVNRFMGKPIRPGGPDWYEGSLRLTPVIIRCGLRLADRIRRLARILMTSLQGLGLLRWAGRYASGERI
jgi:hypothetical protein